MFTYSPLYVGKNFQIKNLYTAFKKTIEYTFDFAGEVHNFYELVSVIDGTVGVTANNEVYTLKAGQAILHEPLEFHNVWAKSDNPTIVVFTFDCKQAPDLSSKIFDLNSTIFAQPSNELWAFHQQTININLPSSAFLAP